MPVKANKNRKAGKCRKRSSIATPKQHTLSDLNVGYVTLPRNAFPVKLKLSRVRSLEHGHFPMNWTGVAGIVLGLAVMLGAFGARALRARLDAYLMGIWERAVFYHFVHALGLLITSVLARLSIVSEGAALWVNVLLFAGIVLFSGSLYALALTGVRTFGAVTPIGGLCFIAGWLLLAAAAFRQSR